MLPRNQTLAVAVVALSFSGVRGAHADTYVNANGDTVDDGYSDPYSLSWHEPRLASGIGVEFAVGGGVGGFTDRTLRDTTSLNGSWNTRISLGTHVPLAFEALYDGTASSLNSALGLNMSPTLLGTTFEGDVRCSLWYRTSSSVRTCSPASAGSTTRSRTTTRSPIRGSHRVPT